VFTGNQGLPPGITKFSDIKLRDYHRMDKCQGSDPQFERKYKGPLNNKLFNDYDENLKKMIQTANKNQEALLNIINQLTSNYKICEEIQPILLSLKSIQYFIREIKQNKYYVYELIFLLQSEYFFKKYQLEKYRESRNNNMEPKKSSKKEPKRSSKKGPKRSSKKGSKKGSKRS
jgi:hypothetical protein